MRLPPVLALTLLSFASSFADRVITIPMGRKIPYRTFKIDLFSELSRSRSIDRWVGVGVTPEIEVAYHGERIAGGPMRDTLDVSYNYVAPIMNMSPGISVGIQDVANRSRDGRRFYIATTWRTAADEIGIGDIPLEVTLGVAHGDRTRPFVGAVMPLSERLRLLAESNGNRIASAAELRLFDNALGVRIVVRDQDVMVGANLSLRF